MSRTGPAASAAALLLAVLAACGSSEHPEGFDGEIDCAPEAWAQSMRGALSRILNLGEEVED